MKNRYEWIDSTRAIAAISVVILHFWTFSLKHFPATNYSDIISLFVFDILDLGKVGVALFFCISGFVIPHSLQQYKDNNVTRFAINRFFRLYPLYWLSIIIAVASAVTPYPIKVILGNITMIQGFLGIKDIMGLYWTLQIELVFYVFCGILFKFEKLKDTRSILICTYLCTALALTMSTIRYISSIKLPIALPLALTLMLFGIVWRRRILDNEDISRKTLFKFCSITIFSLLPISLLAYNKDYGYGETWYRYFFSYSLAICMFLALTTNFKILYKKISYLGKISYSIYLLHPLLGFPILLYFKKIGVSIYLSIFIAMLATFIFSALTYHLLEIPSINYGRRVIDKYIKNHASLNINTTKTLN